MADKEASPAAAAAEAFRRDSQSGPAVELALCIPLNDLRHQTERMSTKVHTLALRLAVFLSDFTHKHANTYFNIISTGDIDPFCMVSRRAMGPSNRVPDGRARWRHLTNTFEQLCAVATSGSATRGNDQRSSVFPNTLDGLVLR